MAPLNRATLDEIDFISKLGTHRNNGNWKHLDYRDPKPELTIETRLKMTEDYLNVAKTKTNWDNIDQVVVLRHALNLIEKYSKIIETKKQRG